MTENKQTARQLFFRFAPIIAIPLLVIGAFALGMRSDEPSSTGTDDWSTKLIDVPVVVASTAVPASEARLAPSASVIGVSVGNWHRAYPIRAMSQSRSHIINDLIDGQAVTVAYCDRTNCARAFVDSKQASPLDLAVGGWFNEDGTSDMLVRIGPNRYQLKSGTPLDGSMPPFPYEGIELEIVTWHEWRTAHPDTDVFLLPSDPAAHH